MSDVKLRLVRGLPGSGKTTHAQKRVDDSNGSAVLVDFDQFFMRGGLYVFDPKRLKEAHAWCLSEAHRHLLLGKDVYVSNTFSQAWELAPYVKLGFPTTILSCTGEFTSVHAIPKHSIDRMKERWDSDEEIAKALKPIMAMAKALRTAEV